MNGSLLLISFKPSFLRYRAWAIDPDNYRGRAPPPMLASLPFDGTTTNREMFQGWQLPPSRPALGVQMVGNLAYVLIPANADIPSCGKQVCERVLRVHLHAIESKCRKLMHFL